MNPPLGSKNDHHFVIYGLEELTLRYHIAIVHIRWPRIAEHSYVLLSITTTSREL